MVEGEVILYAVTSCPLMVRVRRHQVVARNAIRSWERQNAVARFWRN